MLILLATFLFTASQLVMAADKATPSPAPSPPLPQLKIYDLLHNKNLTNIDPGTIHQDLKLIKFEVGKNKFELNGKYSVSALREFSNQAKVTFDGMFEQDNEYTVMLVDLDRTKSHAKPAVYNQFASFNIPAKIENLINPYGQTVAVYEQPVVSCQAKEYHRLMLLAFKQPQNLELKDVLDYAASSKNPDKRKNTDLHKLGRELKLEVRAATAFYVYGETGGACSASFSTLLHSSKSVSSILLLITAITTAWAHIFFFNRKLVTTN